MNFNAYILDWSMDHYAQLRDALTKADFAFEQEEGTEHIRIAVPYERVNKFASLCQTHLNSPFNYVDIQYPNDKKTVLVFKGKFFIISSHKENERVKTWAMQAGLSMAQADWATSF